MSERVGGPCDIRQVTFVKDDHECFPRFGKDRRQATPLGKTTGAAVDQTAIALGMPHDLTDRDLGSGTCQLQSPLAASGGLDEARACQVLDDFHQVVLGNVMGFGDLSDRHDPTVATREIDQRAKRIVGVAAQFHLFTIEVFTGHV